MAAKDQKDAPKNEKKDATLIIKADLDCQCCYKKVWKVLCKLQEKEKVQFTSTNFDEKNKTVTISGPFDPQAFSQKIKCMACKCNVILDVQVKPDPPPPPPPAVTPAPPAPKPTPAPAPKTPVCEGDTKLTVKVEPNITVGAAAACCHHAQGGHHGGCKSSSSCGGGSAGCSCRSSSSSPSPCGKAPQCRCGSSSCRKVSECRCGSSSCRKVSECRCGSSSCGKVPERCCHHSCSCGKHSGGGCSSGGTIAVCGQPPCKLLFEEQGNQVCSIM